MSTERVEAGNQHIPWKCKCIVFSTFFKNYFSFIKLWFALGNLYVLALFCLEGMKENDRVKK